MSKKVGRPVKYPYNYFNPSHKVIPPWSDLDYFRLSEDNSDISRGWIHPCYYYTVIDGENTIYKFTGVELISFMKSIAGSLFIPHILARITFLYETIGN